MAPGPAGSSSGAPAYLLGADHRQLEVAVEKRFSSTTDPIARAQAEFKAGKTATAVDLLNSLPPDLQTSLCDATMADLLGIMTDETQEIGQRGVALLVAMGEDAGPAAPDRIKPDPTAIFEGFARAGHFSHVAVSYRKAYRQSRLALAPLGLCLWLKRAVCERCGGRDDDLPSMRWTGQTPTFALDQYTRTGKAAVRRYVAESEPWRAFTTAWGVPARDHAVAAGELLFRAEGARVTDRRQWASGLELYARSEPVGCYLPTAAVQDGLALIRSELPLIDQFRSGYITTFNKT